MNDIFSILKLPDYSLPVFLALREIGPMKIRELCAVTERSQASVYRSFVPLRRAGLLARNGLVYSLTMDAKPSLPSKLATTLIPQPFFGSTLPSHLRA